MTQTLVPFNQIGLPDGELSRFENNVSQTFLPIISKEILDGKLLKDISLSAGLINRIEHGMQRAVNGYIVVKKSISSVVGASNGVGRIRALASGNLQAGEILCDGAAISRTANAALFAEIGTIWGAGDGVTTFNVPDFRQRFLLGKAASVGTGFVLGSTGGQVDHTHTVPAHYHGMGLGSTLNITSSGSHTHDQKYQTGPFSITQLSAAGVTTGGNSGGTITGGPETLIASSHIHASGNFAGLIGLVTGGVDGNAAMTSGSNNPPFATVNFAIQGSTSGVNLSVWDGENANLNKDLFLDLYCSNSMTVTLWIF